MTFDPSKPVQTRDGRKARIVFTDRKTRPGLSAAPIGALVELSPGDEDFFWYKKDGGRFGAYDAVSTDLVNVPVKKSTWQPIYSSHISSAPSVCTGNCYTSRWAAEANSMLDAKGYLRRDYEDDEFVGIELEKV